MAFQGRREFNDYRQLRGSSVGDWPPPGDVGLVLDNNPHHASEEFVSYQSVLPDIIWDFSHYNNRTRQTAREKNIVFIWVAQPDESACMPTCQRRPLHDSSGALGCNDSVQFSDTERTSRVLGNVKSLNALLTFRGCATYPDLIRIDSRHHEVDQLILGALLFTLFTSSLPTLLT